MSKTLLKQGLSLAFILAFLVGCASTAPNEDQTETGMDDGSTDTGSQVETGTASREGVDDGEGGLGGDDRGTDEPMEELDSIIYFDFDKATLKSEARSLLLAHAERLKDNPTDVRLEGHADERGSREYNMALGERRANAVRDFLVLQGVSRNDLEVISYGEERPLALGSNERAWAQNRRVEIKY